METLSNPRPQLSPHYVLRWEGSQNAHILLYPEGLIKLNPSAAEILKRCDGQRDTAAIIDDLTQHFPGNEAAIAADTPAFLLAAMQKGWLR